MADGGSCDYRGKQTNFSRYDLEINKLVNEMGFGREESRMAIQDADGNIDTAIEKLVNGNYAPPPYSPAAAVAPPNPAVPVLTEESSVKSKEKDHSSFLPHFLSDLTHRNKSTPTYEDHPTAPPLSSIGGIYPDLPPSNFDNLNSLPPPYEKIEKSEKIKKWEQDENVFHLTVDNYKANNFIGFSYSERCSVCFSQLAQGELDMKSLKENIITQRGKYYHYNCFTKKFGPKCAYCCFPLAQPDKDHELSGKYLMYKNKDYHVECYEKYAGPRCTYCFNVIIEKPNGEFSGNWVVDRQQEFHVECYQKKMYAIWRAKNS